MKLNFINLYPFLYIFVYQTCKIQRNTLSRHEFDFISALTLYYYNLQWSKFQKKNRYHRANSYDKCFREFLLDTQQNYIGPTQRCGNFLSFERKKTYLHSPIKDAQLALHLSAEIPSTVNKENDWQVLSEGSIFKKIRKSGEGPPLRSLDNNITIEFEISRVNGQRLISNKDLDISMLEFPLYGASSGIKEALISMKRLESASFLMSPEMHRMKLNYLGKHFIHEDEWLKFDIELCNFLQVDESWEGYNHNSNFTWLPTDKASELPTNDEIELKGDLLIQQIQDKMESDFNSPYWLDITEQMNHSQLKRVNAHFSKKKQKSHEELSRTSQGYLDNFKSHKNIQYGYTMGDRLEGRSKKYLWRETPYEIEVLFPLSREVEFSKINCTINNTTFVISVHGVTEFKDELYKPSDPSDQPLWMLNTHANNYNSIKAEDNLTRSLNQVEFLRETQPGETFITASKKLCISIIFSKKVKPEMWGTIFKNF